MDKLSPNTLELLDRYLDHNLAEGEQAIIDQLLREDFSVQQALENLKMARGIIESKGMEQLIRKQHLEYMATLKQNELRAIRTRTFSSEMGSKWMKIAASIIFILSTGILVQFILLDTNSIYRSNFIAYEASGKRSNTVSSENAIDSLYRNQLFNKLVISFEASPSYSAHDLFLTGLAYLQTGDASKAISVFEQLNDQNNMKAEKIFQQETEYYLALAYLRNNQTNSALKLFYKIHEDPRHLYHKNISQWELIKMRLLNWKR